MKASIITLIFVGLFLSACSKNEEPQNTEPANYAETKQKLIPNSAKDSTAVDSVRIPTAMPPQPPATDKK